MAAHLAESAPGAATAAKVAAAKVAVATATVGMEGVEASRVVGRSARSECNNGGQRSQLDYTQRGRSQSSAGNKPLQRRNGRTRPRSHIDSSTLQEVEVLAEGLEAVSKAETLEATAATSEAMRAAALRVALAVVLAATAQ